MLKSYLSFAVLGSFAIAVGVCSADGEPRET
jgi:hypothetical protein